MVGSAIGDHVHEHFWTDGVRASADGAIITGDNSDVKESSQLENAVIDPRAYTTVPRSVAARILGLTVSTAGSFLGPPHSVAWKSFHAPSGAPLKLSHFPVVAEGFIQDVLPDERQRFPLASV